jgi:peptide/nickel transport system substrate-binding protein
VPNVNRAAPIALLTLASALAVVSGARIYTKAALGQEPERPLPKAAAPVTNDLLRAVPFDRITLIDGTVLDVEPVSPRPLPVYDPSHERETKRRARGKKSLIPLEGNIIAGKKTDLKAFENAPEEEKYETLRVHLIQAAAGEVRDFELKRENIKTIEYFEDFLLKECDRLIPAHDYARGFECCLRVRARNPGWKGLEERVNHLLFAEGSKALNDGDGERGLRLLRELLSRQRDYPGLIDQLGAAYGKRVGRALDLGLYMMGRRILHELEQMLPEGAIVKSLKAQFTALAMKLVEDSAKASPTERLDALTRALRIWPKLEGIEPLYQQAFEAEPTLEVAVTDIPSPLGPWVRSPADARVTRLLYRPVLASDDDEARQGKRADQLAASVESSDLGRRLLVRIRTGILWSDGSRPVSATDAATDLIDRTDPHSPRYEARWADLLDRAAVADESRVELWLKRPPLRSGPWFLGPVGPAHAGIDGRVATAGDERPLVGTGRYGCVAVTADSIELRLRENEQTKSPQGASASPGRIRRLRETRLPRPGAAVGALKRGEVSLISHVPPDQVKALQATPEIQVGKYPLPVIHLIALDGRNPALRSRALRRALSYAVDRKTLLEDHVLKRPPGEIDRVADGAFPAGNYADAPGVKPLAANAWLARMLVAAARKELGGGPIHLNFEYPALPEAEAVAAKLADAFTQTGIEITTVMVPESRLEGELRAGRRFDLAYRALCCEEPVLEAGALLCPGFDAAPEADALASAASPLILQLLLRLERATEWPTARGLAIQIDRETRDELPVIPLWQLQDHYAWRSRLKGPPPEAKELYQGIEKWEIAPWIARDSWDVASNKSAGPR